MAHTQGAGIKTPLKRRFHTDLSTKTLVLDEEAGIGLLGKAHKVARMRMGPLYTTVRARRSEIRKLLGKESEGRE
ncbi:MAG: hypothetical protein ACYSR6_10310 [Planctomycetota bacterium]|jgi:hypothetical protein